MPDLLTQVLSVAIRTTPNGRTVYDVTTADGMTRSLWDGGTANALNGYAGSGQPVNLRIRQRPKNNGQGVWEDITHFAPAGQALPPEVPQQGFAGQPYAQQPQGGMQPGVM